jgi:hypothetical protein
VSDTELRASFAEQPAGAHDIRLDGGATPFAGQVQIVEVPSFAPASVPYLDPNGIVYWLIHDPLRRALIVDYSSIGGIASRRLVRYEYQGGNWIQTMSVSSPSGLAQLALTPDASALLVLNARHTGVPDTQNAVLELDPVTLETRKTTPIATEGSDAFSMMFVNDGNALIATRAPGSGGLNYAYLYAWKSNQALVRTSYAGDRDATAASADGAIAFISSTAYDPSTGKFKPPMTSVVGAWGCFDTCTSNEFWPASLSRNGSRILAGTEVADSSGVRLGLVNTNAFGNLTGMINPQGTRAYVLDKAYQLHTFDLTSAPVNGQYPEIAPTIAVPIDGGLGYSLTRMAISLDGKTAFLGTYYGLRIVPLPN